MKHPAKATVWLLAVVLAGCSTTHAEQPPVATPTAAVASAPDPPPPSSAGTAVEAPTGWPQPLIIPKLGVAAPVVGECETLPSGAIEPPADIHATCVTGRFDVDPAGLGTTTLTGHTTRAASVGALEQIGRLAAGDTVTVAGRTWTVAETGTYLATALPDRLFTTDGPRRLVLGTCHLDAAVAAGAPYTQTDIAVAVPG
jgi:sortase family protein